MRTSWSKQGVLYGILLIVAIWTVLPMVWMIRISLMQKVDAFSMPPVFAFKPTLAHYFNLLSGRVLGTDFYKYYMNSALIAIGTTLLTLLIGGLAAFSFSRYRFKGDKFLAFAVIASRMLPPVAFAIPLFFLMRGWGTYDTRIGLILLYTAFHAPFATWMMKAFFDEVPKEIDEAALVDGCTRFGAFFRTTLPLAAPGFAATAIYNFILAWNEFLFSLIFTSSNSKTLSVVTLELIGEVGVEWGPMTATATLAVLPSMLFAIMAQKYLVRGLTMGAVKG